MYSLRAVGICSLLYFAWSRNTSDLSFNPERSLPCSHGEIALWEDNVFLVVTITVIFAFSAVDPSYPSATVVLWEGNLQAPFKLLGYVCVALWGRFFFSFHTTHSLTACFLQNCGKNALLHAPKVGRKGGVSVEKTVTCIKLRYIQLSDGGFYNFIWFGGQFDFKRPCPCPYDFFPRFHSP